MKMHKSIQHLMNMLHKLDTFILVFLCILNAGVRLGKCHVEYCTWTAVIKDLAVLRIACTNGGPKASWTSFRSFMAGSRQVMIFFMRISVTEACWGILGMTVKNRWCPCLYMHLKAIHLAKVFF
jgi:hypothetical protein